jgi:hypothetical protein
MDDNASPAEVGTSEGLGLVPEPDLLERLKQRTLPKHGGRDADSWSHHWNLTLFDSELHAAASAEIERLRGEQPVMVRLLVQCDGVLSTLEGESTEEQEMLDSLRRAIRNATTLHRGAEADLLAVRERLGA